MATVGAKRISLLVSGLISLDVSTKGGVLVTVLIFIIKQFLVSLIGHLLGEVFLHHGVRVDVPAFLGDLIDVLLGMLLVVSIMKTLNIGAASFTTLLTSTKITVNVTLSKGLRGFTKNLVVLFFGPCGVNS